MDDILEHCFYESGLTADGCWDELDDYAKESIERFAKLLIEDLYIDMSMLELRLRNRIDELEQFAATVANGPPRIPQWVKQKAEDILAKD